MRQTFSLAQQQADRDGHIATTGAFDDCRHTLLWPKCGLSSAFIVGP
jgi:hypothetical protein